MKRKTPPFRADHVGSLLRPASLQQAKAKFAKGEISAVELKAVEDREISRIIDKQQALGLDCATDGEFRRHMWHRDFFQHLNGVIEIDTDKPYDWGGVKGAALNLMLYRLVIRPVSALSGIADRVSLGEFEAPEFAVRSNDEIGVLSESFNRMRTSLAHAMKMLDS